MVKSLAKGKLMPQVRNRGLILSGDLREHSDDSGTEQRPGACGNSSLNVRANRKSPSVYHCSSRKMFFIWVIGPSIGAFSLTLGQGRMNDSRNESGTCYMIFCNIFIFALLVNSFYLIIFCNIFMCTLTNMCLVIVWRVQNVFEKKHSILLLASHFKCVYVKMCGLQSINT